MLTNDNDDINRELDKEQKFYRKKPAEAFGVYEKRMFEIARNSLQCTGCSSVGKFSNKGLTGAPNQGGFRTISVVCTKALGGCGASVRLGAALEKIKHAGCTQYGLELTAAKQTGLTKLSTAPKQQTLNLASMGISLKRTRSPSPDQTERGRGEGPSSPILSARKEKEPAHPPITTEIGPQPITDPPAGSEIAPQWVAMFEAMRLNMVELQQSVLALTQTVARLQEMNGPSPNVGQDYAPRTGPGQARGTPERVDRVAPLDRTRGINARGLPGGASLIGPGQARGVVHGLRRVAFQAEPEVGDFRGEANPQPQLWSTVVGRHSRRSALKKAKTMLLPRATPMEFEKTHIRINDSRSLRNCRSARDVSDVISSTLKHIGVKGKVVAFSKIGNSVLELYTACKDRNFMHDAYAQHEVEVLLNYNVAEPAPHARMRDPTDHIVRRLTYLMRRANVVRLRECILQGYSDRIKELVNANFAPQRQEYDEEEGGDMEGLELGTEGDEKSLADQLETDGDLLEEGERMVVDPAAEVTKSAATSSL